MKTGEQDVVTGWRRLLAWRPSQVAGIGRRMRRRERHQARHALRKGERVSEGVPTPDEAQRLHEERRLEDARHDQVSCWCCCRDCDFPAGRILEAAP